MSRFNPKDIGSVVVLQAKLDKNSAGEKRHQYIFPQTEDGAVDYLAPVAGGVYISKDVNLPDTIIIQIKKIGG